MCEPEEFDVELDEEVSDLFDSEAVKPQPVEGEVELPQIGENPILIDLS